MRVKGFPSVFKVSKMGIGGGGGAGDGKRSFMTKGVHVWIPEDPQGGLYGPLRILMGAYMDP